MEHAVANTLSKDVKKISYNDNYIVSTANEIVRGRQKMTLREAQLLHIVISQITKKDTDLITCTTTIPELAAFMDINKQSLYHDIGDICDRLLQRTISIHTPTGWKKFQWVSEASYTNKTGKLTIKLHENLKPYLIEISTNFTKSYLGTLLSFRSYYTIRLYQLIVCDSGERNQEEWYFSCDDLRDYFQTGKKYKLSRGLIDNTVKAAIEELNASDYACVWDCQEHYGAGKGKPLAGYSFKAKVFANLEQKNKWIDEQNIRIKKEEMQQMLQQTFF